MKKLEADILKILEEDCRYSPSKIAVMLDTSEAEVSAAIKNMEESGVIVKYTAIVNGEALSEEIVQALIEVRVTPQKVNGFDAIAEEIYRFDEVQSLYLMSGGYDLAVFIEGRSLRDVSRFVAERLSTIDGILSTATHFILKKYKIEGTIADRPDDSMRLSVQP
ncbi:Lrp/AsnC family transcriptional regulator [Candidatus Borkfalkia ceftriaxoniphila]|mgnify:FL=1|jgi:transcriptional regulator, asnC family|uniref:Lrp/AsnC family transcriptional regulator n=1 Tax=Candidatus Borkfalkia ceftriaxoniphila TaxID=2508949 RepID=A0A4Q2KCD1_9FIRM|nr:Lrp/AsnC family transcriptional regulator [Candidatus Borkfalkia ceftriaxoniphila]RXZ61637.1 Lrp/AsnC family transcriptional regulator [Candidatus Borkfalkia ceftriaxoniphila]